MRVILAQPRGFCAGVERAIEIVEAALQQYGPPIYVRHEIVHNPRVVENLKAKGVRFVEQIEQVPTGAVTVFSAHGVSEKVEQDASTRGLRPLDATCPLVSKVHVEGRRYSAKGYDIILIGHENHPEVEGTVGQIPGPVLLVKRHGRCGSPPGPRPRKGRLHHPDDTVGRRHPRHYRRPAAALPEDRRTGRQGHLLRDPEPPGRRALARLRRGPGAGGRRPEQLQFQSPVRGQQRQRRAELPDRGSVEARSRTWLEGKKSIGITAGASTPEELVQDLIAKLREFADLQISTMDGIIENVRFGLPPELDHAAAPQ